jgi:DNA polymerase IIIc chi subunit
MAFATQAGRRRRSPRFDRLEGRALLSGLSYALTTNQSTYEAGQPVKITLTETNTTSQAVQVITGPDTDNFVVSENGVAIWVSEPIGLNLAELTTLQPGQSVTDSATWDGVPNEGPSRVLAGGSFTVSDPSVYPLSASFQIDSPLSYSLTTDQSDYAIGQPIQITYTETNGTSQAITVSISPTDFAISEGDGTLVADVPANWSVAGGSTTLAPGQSITETAAWNGVANVGSLAGTNVWNSIDISDPTAPAGVSATARIADPLATGLSASSPSFATGQPVTLTYTATNVSSVPVTVLDIPGTFSIQKEQPNGDTTVFSQVGTGGSLVTLQPGQSLTQTATWNPAGVQVPAGSYVANFSGPWNGSTTTFQVGAPGSISTSLTTNQADYAFGTPVKITLTLSNQSNKRVKLIPSKSSNEIALYRGGQLVWQTRKLPFKGTQSISADRSVELRGTISDRTTTRPSARLASGDYTLEVFYDGYMASQTIQVE